MCFVTNERFLLLPAGALAARSWRKIILSNFVVIKYICLSRDFHSSFFLTMKRGWIMPQIPGGKLGITLGMLKGHFKSFSERKRGLFNAVCCCFSWHLLGSRFTKTDVRSSLELCLQLIIWAHEEKGAKFLYFWETDEIAVGFDSAVLTTPQ